ncbi:MAG: rhamnan synthesis F family protein [Bifidobacteriaceae bacterium]|nr:rhamnan synthesis F family protein [Bifidobacteriaceae bacterium]
MSQTIPKFSVIIPAYNVSAYIADTLQSVVNQTYRNIEIIVVNDASTDNTLEIIQSITKTDDRVIIIDKPVNEGLHLARTSGVEVAHGEWITFVDGDDELTLDALEQLLPFTQDNNIDMWRYGREVISSDMERAETFEQQFNASMKTSLTGDNRLLATFSNKTDENIVWTSIGLLIRSAVCKKAFDDMEHIRLQRLEDAYEYFVMAYYANAIDFCTQIKALKYYWGRGITGSNIISSQMFNKHQQEMKAVLNAFNKFAIKHVNNKLIRSSVAWVKQEIPVHVSTEFALRIAPAQDREALYYFIQTWGINIVFNQVLRITAERLHALYVAGAVPHDEDEFFRYYRLYNELSLSNKIQYSTHSKKLMKQMEVEFTEMREKEMNGNVDNSLTHNLSQYNDNGKKRLAIFCFYDRNGEAASYLKPLLDEIQKNVTDIVIVSNGGMKKSTRKFFLQYTTNVWERDNSGLDIAAYKFAMKRIGWRVLSRYDEVICTNDTIMGPVYPFEEMFATMDARDVDFWGITAYQGESLIPTHLQSYWHVYRRSLVQSSDFQEYWDTMPLWNDYATVTHEHEMKFTEHFAELGFKWASYIDYKKYAINSSYPLLYMPMQLIRDERCPIFKRRSFFVDYSAYFSQTAGQPALELYKYLRDNTAYDTDLIWDSILPNYNIADIRAAMHLDYVLPKNTVQQSNVGKKARAAFIFHIYFLDMLEDTYRYLVNVPSNVDLYITTTKDKIKLIQQKLEELHFDHAVKYISVINRGRDVSALLVAAKDVILSGKYDVIGFAHDKKSSQNQASGHFGTETQGFTYKLMENTLGSKEYVQNVISLFESNNRLGLLAPMPPYHALYYAHTLPTDWGPNFENTDKLLGRMNISVPLDIKKPTMSAMGSCYWFRVDALRPLFELNWKYKDFLPEGKMGADGSISHAIERANGYVAQSQGYYPAWVMNDEYARIEIDSLLFAHNTLLSTIGAYRNGETLLENCESLGQVLSNDSQLKLKIKRKSKAIVRKASAVSRNVLPSHFDTALRRSAWWVIHRLHIR